MREPASQGGSEGAAVDGGREHRLDPALPGLPRWGRAIATSLAEAMLADEDEAGAIIPAPPALAERAVDWLDRSVGRGSSTLRFGFAALCLLVELLPIVVLGAPSRMSRLPVARRVAYLEALEASRLGLFTMIAVAFKVPLVLAAFEAPEELAAIGYDRGDILARRLPVARAAAPEVSS
jgi:hypothetical protein